jgi:hypothetical protein
MKRLVFAGLLWACATSGSAQVVAPYSSNVQMPAFIVSGTSQIYAADGTASLPSIAFASESTLGFYRSASGTITTTGKLGTTGGQTITAGGALVTSTASAGTGAELRLGASGDVLFQPIASGIVQMTNSGRTIGIRLQASAVPVIGTCGTGSPAVTAGSSDTAGELTVAAGGTLTSCAITFGGTWSVAPYCVANVSTATAGNTRAIGVTSTTTTMTLTPAAAFAASDKVWWLCMGQK